MKETIKGISTIYLQTLAHSYLKLFMQNNVTLYFYRKYHRATRLTKFIQNITTNTLMLRKKVKINIYKKTTTVVVFFRKKKYLTVSNTLLHTDI